MTTDYRTLSLLIHAASKTGKTTLSATAPKPICYLDAEGGSKFLPGSQAIAARLGRPLVMVHWDVSGPPPVWDGTWDVAVVSVSGWGIVQQAYSWLATGQHTFQTIVVDSISEIQRRAKTQLVGTEQMRIQDWGQLLTVMDNVIRGFRDFANDPMNPIRVAVFIAESRTNQQGKTVPYMQGQIATSLPYWMDIVGYLYVDQMEGPPDPATGQPTAIPIRRLLVAPHQLYEAGERVQGLVGPVIDSPDISDILDRVYPAWQTPDPSNNQGEPVQ